MLNDKFLQEFGIDMMPDISAHYYITRPNKWVMEYLSFLIGNIVSSNDIKVKEYSEYEYVGFIRFY